MSLVNATRPATPEDLLARVNGFAADVEIGWLLLSASLVMFMQAGFVTLEAGSSRLQHSAAIVLKYITVYLFTMIVFLLTFPFSFGKSDAGFVATEPLGFSSVTYALWFFQSHVAGTSTTVMWRGMMERVSVFSVFFFTLIHLWIIYMPIAHWIWSSSGFLSVTNTVDAFLGTGALDVAGSAVVHLSGSIVGLIGSIVLGAREAAIDPGTKRIIRVNGHSVVMQALGWTIIWFCFYGLCFGHVQLGFSAGLVAINLSVSGTFSSLSCGALIYLLDKRFDLLSMMNALLAGLVSISAGCSVVNSYAALIFGILTGFVYELSSRALSISGIDDSAGAFSVHGSSAILGMILTGFFSSTGNVKGVFYGGGKLLGAQLIAILCVVAWSSVIGLIFVALLHYFNRLLAAAEGHGSNEAVASQLGLSAYPEITNMIKKIESVVEFENMIDDPTSLLLWTFHKFLEHEFAAENLDFIFAAKRYRESSKAELIAAKAADNAEKSKEHLQVVRESFEKVYTRYIKDESITLPVHISKKIQAIFESGEIPSLAVFDAAEKETASILKCGPWKRFKVKWDERDSIPEVQAKELPSFEKRISADASIPFRVSQMALDEREFNKSLALVDQLLSVGHYTDQLYIIKEDNFHVLWRIEQDLHTTKSKDSARGSHRIWGPWIKKTSRNLGLPTVAE